MISYTLAHVGINCANAEQARKGAALFEAMFGLTMKEGNGHIAIGTPDVAAAVADLEGRGFQFNKESAKYKADGTLNAIYLADEICGFAVHLVGNK